MKNPLLTVKGTLTFGVIITILLVIGVRIYASV